MWSIGQLADRERVSKQAVSRAVKSLVERHGLTVELDARGRIAKLNVAEYDHLRGRFADPSKAQAPRQAEEPVRPASESYDEALRQKTWHEAEKRRLELAEIKKQLVRVDRLQDALARAGEDIVRTMDRLPNAADELAAAFAREGVHGMRVALKQITVRMRQDVAQALIDIAAAAPSEEHAPTDL
jgi:DNA-binding transcriptional ArsR family regulator